MNSSFTYIETSEDLASVCKFLQTRRELGVDFECENNLHHYGAYIAIIQLSTGMHHYIVDVLKLKNIDPLLEVFTNDRIQKVFHDINFDLRILYHQYKCRPKNVFDTQIAAQLLGFEKIGLGSLLEQFFGTKKKSKFQMADWTKRPLKKEMLEYALGDTKYLLSLRDKLIALLKEKNRLEWMVQECRSIDKLQFDYCEGGFLSVRGSKSLDDKKRAVLKRLFDARNELAKAADRPAHYIMSAKRLLEVVSRPPKSLQDWQSIKGVHPIVRRRATICFTAVQKARRERLSLPRKTRYRYSCQEQEEIHRLSLLRDKRAEELGIAKSLIASREQLQDLVCNKRCTLRPWQKKLLEQ
ncbi:hypothetical protein GF342_05350 [Candidatus Woesearchaeota archaeon]|nr:hypothetical protein [Candidatus Woesearchaeota archaeon]